MTTSREKNSTSSLMILLVPTTLFMLGLFWLDIFTWQISVMVLVVMVMYVYARDYLWVVLIMAVPSLSLGPVLAFRINERWVYDATISELLLVLVAIVFLLKLVIEKSLGRLKLNMILWMLLAFCAWALLSFFEVRNLHNFVYQTRVLFFGLVAFVLSYHLLDTRKKLVWFYASLSGLALILGGELIYRFFEMGLSSKFFLYRSYVLIPIGAIALAAAMEAMILPLVLVEMLRNEKRGWLLLLQIAGLTVGSLGLFITLGKGALIAISLALLIILFRFKEGRIMVFVTGLLLTAIIFAFFMTSIEGLYSRVVHVFVDKNVEFRLDEYRIASKILNEHWLTGVGLGQEPLYFERQFNFQYNEIVNNFILQIILDLGVIGLSLFGLVMAFVASTFWRLFYKIKNTPLDNPFVWWIWGSFACLVAVTFNATVEVTIFTIPYSIILWLIIGSVVSMEEQINSKS